MCWFNIKSVCHEEAKKILAIFLLTDGSVFWEKGKKRFVVCFSSKDISLHNLFIQFVFRAFRRKPTFIMNKSKRCLKTGFAIRPKSNVAIELFSLSPTFKTAPKNITSDDFLNGPQPTISFLNNSDDLIKEISFRIAMSCDGSIGIASHGVKPKPSLRLSCTHPNLILEWKQLAEDIGISMNVMRDRRWWSGLGGLETRKSSNILRFKEIGGFLPVDVKVVRGRFIGLPKNFVLDMAVKILGL